jgi:hypothetical protein
MDSPSPEDLLALVPDMDLLEAAASDALTNPSSKPTGSNRKATVTPILSDRNADAATTQALSSGFNHDDPYAALMPEPEAAEEAAPAARSSPKIMPPPKPVTAPQRAPQSAPAAPPPQAAKPPARPTASPAPAAPTPAPARKMPNPESVAVPSVMDRDYITRNRIVELYLSGSLPIRGATAFERFCQENPQILDEIGLAERIHAGLKLLQVSGTPEPWQEKPKRLWEQPYVLAVLSALVLVLGVGMLVLNSHLSDQTRKVTALQKLVTEQPIDAAGGTASVDIDPSRSGPSPLVQATIGGSSAQLVSIRINATRSDFRAFRITIDRVNQGRVAVLNNLIKDSNGELGFSLNSSALGAGLYQLTIEGLDWRGDPQPDSWTVIAIRH